MSEIMKEIGCSDYNKDVPQSYEYVKQHIVDKGGQLEAPTDYITIK